MKNKKMPKGMKMPKMPKMPKGMPMSKEDMDKMGGMMKKMKDSK